MGRIKDLGEAIIWARQMLKSKDWVVLDLETTALEDQAQIVSIGLI